LCDDNSLPDGNMSLATSKLKTTKEKGLGFSSVKTESCVNFNPFDPVPLVRTQLDYDDDDEHEVNWHKSSLQFISI
jgi:hypothetical protein